MISNDRMLLRVSWKSAISFKGYVRGTEAHW
jgi:hypothetical protein